MLLLVLIVAYAIARKQWHVESKRSDRPAVKLCDNDKACRRPRLCCAGAMNQTVRPPLQPDPDRRIPPVRTIAPRPARSRSRCSTTRTIGRVRGAPDNAYTAGVICAKVARYAERIHHPDRLMQPLRRTGPKGSGAFRADLLGRRARSRRREIPRGRSAPRRGGGLALLLRRHHGPRDARRHQPAAPRQEIFRLPFHHLRQRRPTPALPPAPAGSPAPIRARWRSPIWW